MIYKIYVLIKGSSLLFFYNFELFLNCRKYALLLHNQIINGSILLDNADLHFVLYQKQHFEYLRSIFESRKRTNKELWFIYFEEATSIEEIVLSLKDIHLDLDDDVIVGLKGIDQTTLYEIYRIGPNSIILYNRIGTWHQKDNDMHRLQMTSMKKWHRRYDLKGHNFKVTGLEEAPFINYIILNSVTGKYEMEGSFTDLLNILANIMNFTYTWTLPPDNAWGGLQKDGSWNGMIKLLINEDVDFCKIAFICWLF